jgi:CRISPR/Cas system CMR-associated protein Cmr5 small subunit
MAALNAAPSSLYLRATDEVLALLRWIRQFADARKAMEG